MNRNRDNASASSSSSAYSEDPTSESGEESPDSEEEQPRETVNVAFDFAQPSESDFQPLRALLNSYAPSTTFPLSALVDAVISAPSATVIRATRVFETDGGVGEDGGDGGDGEDDGSSVVGVGAVLRNGGSLLRGMFEGNPKRVERLFSDEHHVVVIERLINSPPQLGGPLLGAIFEGTNLAKGKRGKRGKKRAAGQEKGIGDGEYVVVGKAYVSGGERGYALPEFGCLAEDGVAGELVWVGDEDRGGDEKAAEGRCVRFVAVVEGVAGLADWERIVEASCAVAGG